MDTKINNSQTTANTPTPSNIILVVDNRYLTVQAIQQIGSNGAIKFALPTKKNLDTFMRIDNQGSPLSDLFKSYIPKIQNADQQSYYRVPAQDALSTAANMQQLLDICGGLSDTNCKELRIQQITSDQPMANLLNRGIAQKSSKYKFDPERIDWPMMEKMGMGKKALSDLGILDTLLKGHKTDELINIKLNLGIIENRLDARLSLKQKPDGDVVVMIHGVRRAPDLESPFLGHNFSAQDKANLLSTGNMGRVVDLLNAYTGERIPSVISIDPLTNELLAMRRSHIRIPDILSGVKLSLSQKQTLREGKAIRLDGLQSRSGEGFSATVQINADKKRLAIISGTADNKKTHKINSAEEPKLDGIGLIRERPVKNGTGQNL